MNELSSILYGEFPVTVEDDRTDRVGIRSVLLAQMWRPRSAENPLQMLSQKPVAPNLGGGMGIVESFTRQVGGALKTFWRYEGIDGDGKSVTFKTRDNTLDYEFSPGFSQVDIGLHPKLQELIDAYEGQIIDGEIYFPPLIDKGGGGSALTKAGGGSTQKRSPVGLMRDFLRMEGTYTCRYMALSLAGLQNGVGRIHTSGLPGQAPRLEDGRNWLKAPTAYARRGPAALEILESYWASGPGGWPGPIYGNLGNSGGADGLTTGSLVTGSL